MGEDDETKAARQVLSDATAAGGTEPAVEHACAAADRVVAAARRQARRTPAPIPRLAPLPSIPEEA
jgi:hypothetical protein